MSPEWQFLLDTVIRWLPYIAVIIFIPFAVLIVRCLSKGACRNGPVQKINSFTDEEFWIGDERALSTANTQKLKLESFNRHKSLPNLQDNHSSIDVFRSVALTREPSGLASQQVHEFEPQEIERGICWLCKTIYTENNLARNLPCSHHFHQKCAEDWFCKRGYCPQCIKPSSVSIIKI
jgi:hypothetical protein